MNKLAMLSAFLLVLTTSCNKDDIEPDYYEDPQLYIKGSFKNGGSNFNFAAGEDRLHGKTYRDTINDVRVYIFELAEEAEPEPIKYFSIAITGIDSVVYQPSHVEARKAIVNGNHDYVDEFNQSAKIPHSAVIVTWYDSPGSLFQSVNVDQRGSKFIITKVTSQVKDGAEYLVVEGSFTCVLKHYLTTDTVNIENASFKIAFVIN